MKALASRSVALNLSLEERVAQASTQLALIYAWASLERGAIKVDDSEVLHRITVAAQDASALLEPLSKVPASIGNWTPDREGGDDLTSVPTARPNVQSVYPVSPDVLVLRRSCRYVCRRGGQRGGSLGTVIPAVLVAGTAVYELMRQP